VSCECCDLSLIKRREAKRFPPFGPLFLNFTNKPHHHTGGEKECERASSSSHGCRPKTFDMFARIARRILPLDDQSARTATTTTTMTFCRSSSLGGVSATMKSRPPFMPSPETGKRTEGIIFTAKGRMIFPIVQSYSMGTHNSVVFSTPSSSFTALPRPSVNSVGHYASARQAQGCSAVGASLNQIRSVWQEVIRQVPSDDPNRVGKLTFEDPDLADTRMVRAMRAEGEIMCRMCESYFAFGAGGD
jgi:hypothetical protein